MSQSKFSTRFGVKQQTWANYEVARTMPSPELIADIATQMGYDPAWLLTGSGEPRGESSLRIAPATLSQLQSRIEELEQQIEEAESQPTVRIPIYDIPASAGDEAPSVETVDTLVSYGEVFRDWLVREVRAQPDRCFIVRVKGDSMHDFLHDGDLVLCERQDFVDHDGIFVLSVNGNPYIKRVARGAQPLSIDLISHNTIYPTRRVSEESGDSVFVHGRYLRRITR